MPFHSVPFCSTATRRLKRKNTATQGTPEDDRQISHVLFYFPLHSIACQWHLFNRKLRASKTDPPPRNVSCSTEELAAPKVEATEAAHSPLDNVIQQLNTRNA